MKYTVYIIEKEQRMHNIYMPKNSILIKDENGELTACMDFPRNYKGTNPTLKVYYWDEIHECFEADIWQNETTRALWAIYAKGGYKRMGKIMLPQIAQVYKQVPHNTKIGNVQASYMGDPDKRRRNEKSIGYHDFTRPRQSSYYHYYSSIGVYGKAGDSMRI